MSGCYCTARGLDLSGRVDRPSPAAPRRLHAVAAARRALGAVSALLVRLHRNHSLPARLRLEAYSRLDQPGDDG